MSADKETRRIKPGQERSPEPAQEPAQGQALGQAREAERVVAPAPDDLRPAPRRSRTAPLAAMVVFSVGVLSLAVVQGARRGLFFTPSAPPGQVGLSGGPARPLPPAQPAVQPPRAVQAPQALPTVQVAQEIPLTLVPAPPSLTPQPVAGEGDIFKAIGEMIEEAEGTDAGGGEDLVPFGSGRPGGGGGSAAAAAQASKPRLQTIPNIYDVTEEGVSQAGFKRMRLVNDRSPSSVARMSGAWLGGYSAGPAAAQPAASPQSRAGLPACTNCGSATTPYRAEPVKPLNPTVVGSARFLGTCGDGYAYELKNQTGRPLRTSFTSSRGDAWDVNLPPGGTTVVRSKEPLTGLLVGRQGR